MAAAKIEAFWDQDLYDNSILIISKKRGKLNMAEVEDCQGSEGADDHWAPNR